MRKLVMVQGYVNGFVPDMCKRMLETDEIHVSTFCYDGGWQVNLVSGENYGIDADMGYNMTATDKDVYKAVYEQPTKGVSRFDEPVMITNLDGHTFGIIANIYGTTEDGTESYEE